MGFFGLFQSAEAKRKDEVRTGAVAPDRSERKRCWEARDGFYQCLDKHNVIDATRGEGKAIASNQCANENKKFEEDCAAAWVKYFKEYRVAEHKKKLTLERLEREAANRVPIEMPGPGSPARK